MLRRRQKQSGQAMLESALVLLIFLCIFIGILDFGQFLYFHQALVDRARAGARYAAVNPSATNTQIQNFTVYNDPDVSTGSPLISGLTTTMVSALRSGTPGASNATAGVRISNFPFQFFSPYITGTFTNAPVTAILPSEAP